MSRTNNDDLEEENNDQNNQESKRLFIKNTDNVKFPQNGIEINLKEVSKPINLENTTNTSGQFPQDQNIQQPQSEKSNQNNLDGSFIITKSLNSKEVDIQKTHFFANSEFFFNHSYPETEFTPTTDLQVEYDQNKSQITKVSVAYNNKRYDIEPGNFFCLDEGNNTSVVYRYTSDQARILRYTRIERQSENDSLNTAKTLKFKNSNFFYGQFHEKTLCGYWSVAHDAQKNRRMLNYREGRLVKASNKLWIYVPRKSTEAPFSLEQGMEYIFGADEGGSKQSIRINFNDELEFLTLRGWLQAEELASLNSQICEDQYEIRQWVQFAYTNDKELVIQRKSDTEQSIPQQVLQVAQDVGVAIGKIIITQVKNLNQDPNNTNT